MRSTRLLTKLCLVVAAGLVVLSGCMDQYHPERYIEKEANERATAAKPAAKLTAAGELPVAGATISVDQRYTDLCSTCHGAQGGGDGPAGVALNPKPRNFQDASWQAGAADDRIFSVIKNGGASVGLSAMMAPWGAVLGDDEIKNMVAKVRSFKK